MERIRTANEFSRKEIAEIAIAYASTGKTVARTTFCEEYMIRESTFYVLLHKAVSECIVSDRVVELMRHKSTLNSYRSAGTKGKEQSERCYDRLMLRRQKFEFSKSVRRKIALQYANSALSKKEFCSKECITVNLFDRTIKSAIVDSLISEKFINILQKKAYASNDSDRVTDIFSRLRSERFENRRRKKQAK